MLSINHAPAFFSDLLESLTTRGRSLLRRDSARPPLAQADLTALGELLISRRGEASAVALAETLLASYAAAEASERLLFLKALAERFGPRREAIEAAIEAVRSQDGTAAMDALHAASEPRRQELFRRLNLAVGGTASLVRMREELLDQLTQHEDLRVVDADFSHLFTSWFNRGFLILKPIDWTTPANILEKIIRYEAVHAIRDWDDLRSRVAPDDRRCYGFFHPQLVDEPLIFVEIALTRDPRCDLALLDAARVPIAASEATTAVFYSISNTQKGLAGVSFGNFLIKQVVDDLTRELPNLKLFVTLSPVPAFAAWLRRERAAETSQYVGGAERVALEVVDDPDWPLEPSKSDPIKPVILGLAAHYFLKARTESGRLIDPVARFHLGNGARLERLNFLGDVSAKAIAQSHGLMVNYLYVPEEIETNHEALAERGIVAASAEVKRLLAPLQFSEQAGR